MSDTVTRKRQKAPGTLAEAYRPLPGVHDEMMDEHGRVRPAWSEMIAALDAMKPEALAERFIRADRYLRDAGVYFRLYSPGEAQERAWPLAHLPLIIEETEWETVSQGLAERADLLEELAADIYGDAKLVARGIVPPAIIAGSREFVRPMVGVKPAGGHFLHFCAFELGRGPDGRWWVLGDRTQAPSGAGFALENRVATTRALPEIHAALNVHRLAGFFRSFRDALFGHVREKGDRAAVLTPGLHNETYFEHAYIARYLGLLLLEGEDLTVAEGRIMVRTVAGLKPVSVLWRRLDANFLDPIELNQESRIGTPGMMAAIRQGSAVMVNAPGSGVLETRALLAFLPAIAEALTGAPLKLPGIATWWCGQREECAHVIGHLERMMIGPALSTALPFEDSATLSGGKLTTAEREALAARLKDDGAAHVGQEAVTLSTSPVFLDGRLEPRPVVLRAFACRTPDGWIVMPGGFARIGTSLDSQAIAMQRGGRAADVWITATRAVEQVSLMSRDSEAVHRAEPASLPSRAADNLLWLGRYIERAEGAVRILRAYHSRLAESLEPKHPLLRNVAGYLQAVGIDAAQPVPEGLLRSIDSTFASAGRIRDRFSPDGWAALGDLAKTAHRFSGKVGAGDDAARAMTILLRKIAGFSGLVHENMSRFTGWRFLEIGRRLERGIQMASLSARLADPRAPEGSLEMLLEIADSVLTHRRRYAPGSGRLAVLDLLTLDDHNPRSVLFQLTALKREIEGLGEPVEHGHASPLGREVLRLHTAVAIAEPQALDGRALHRIARDIGGVAAMVERTYLQ